LRDRQKNRGVLEGVWNFPVRMDRAVGKTIRGRKERARRSAFCLPAANISRNGTSLDHRFWPDGFALPPAGIPYRPSTRGTTRYAIATVCPGGSEGSCHTLPSNRRLHSWKPPCKILPRPVQSLCSYRCTSRCGNGIEMPSSSKRFLTFSVISHRTVK
jgi:hypothetical protein